MEINKNIIYTDNFKKWFGDWERDLKNSSKVTKDGKPLVMIHETDWDMSKEGNYTFDRNKTEHDCHFFKSWESRPGYEYGDKKYYVYLNIRNPKYLYEESYPFACQFEDDGEHDGVIWIDPKDNNKVVAVVYESNKIKSATDNNGNFSIESNKITEDIKSNIKNSDKDQIQKFAQLVSDYRYSLYGEKIIKKGNKWQVTDHTGKKNLGTYDTKKDAEERLRQVEIFKHMNEYTKKDLIQEINISDDILNESDDSYFGVTAADGGLIIGTISKDINMVKKIRKSLADKYKEIFKIKRITNQEELLFNLTESYRLDEEDGANFSGSFSAEAPEHLKKVIDPSGELPTTDPEGTSHIVESLPNKNLNKLNKNFINEYNKLAESILDIPQKDYYDGVIKNDKMTPECRKQIIDTIKKWKEQINFDFNVYKIWAKGSLLTKRYNDTTDLDISIYTDMSKEQLEEIFDIIPKGKNIQVDGKDTDHPLDFYIMTKGENTPLENLDCIYDVAHDKWVKKDDNYENDIPLEYVIQVANFFVNGCVVALNNYENDKILYNYYRNLDPDKQEINKDEKKSKVSAQKDKLKADLDGMRVALRMISNFRQDAYNGEDSNPVLLTIQTEITNPHVTFNEQLAKILEKFEIRQKLRDCVKECQDLIGIEETTGLEESEKDPNNNSTKIAACSFGRMNPPTRGHALLWKTVASVPADDHFIYASHTQDSKKNPLDYATKSSAIKMALKENNINADFVDSNARTLIDMVVELYNKGYTDLIFVAGQDRLNDIVSIIQKYNDVPNKEGKAYHFNSISGICAGDRDPDSDGIEGVSASKVRQMALEGDFEGFCKNVPISDKFILKDLYDEIRSIMM